jgi:ubiquinone/menaquinone biosynthesis C-methylase UbiE
MSVDPIHFPKYHELNARERFFLRFCCYYPPKPPREWALDEILDVERHVTIYEEAFGHELWSLIAGKSVLDVGCGWGGYVLAMGSKTTASVVGLDILPLFATASQEGQRRGYDNVAFVQGSTQELADNSFDVVISHDSFEHFNEPEFMLAEMVRLTKPGGSVLIKFGPPWRNPWGRHMGGTIRRDRPWVHLLFPERTIMRCHSVYHNQERLLERYADLDGGLNKMTIGRFRRILQQNPHVSIQTFQVIPIHWARPLANIPILNEFIASSLRVRAIKIGE